jgi:integrating conjugative element protein (TIGR03757 family)
VVKCSNAAPSQRGSHARYGIIAGLLAALLISHVSVAEPRYQVELFTTTAHPPLAGHDKAGQGIELTVYFVDGLTRLNATLSHQLPPQKAAAKAMAATRLGALTHEEQAQLRATATGLLAAQRYELTRYPALVINGEAVIYGLTDPTEAVRHYQTWRGEVQL